MTVAIQLPVPRLDLRRAIGATGLPHWKIALLAGMSATRLSHIVTGRRLIRPDEARRLADVLGRQAADLFPELAEETP